MKKITKEISIINIDPQKSTPIYKQIVESIIIAIENETIIKGSALPSVNGIAEQFKIARGSIFKSYNELRSLGIVESIPGKGYYVINTKQNAKKNIFLMMSTFNPYREEFYNAFIDRLKNIATVDLYFHHHNIDVFETLIQNHSQNYNCFVIMPVTHKKTKSILKNFNHKQLYLVDSGHQDFVSKYPGVYLDYEHNFFNFLSDQEEKIKKYKRVVLLFSSNMRNYELIRGFESYFKDKKQEYIVVNETDKFHPIKRDLCIVIDDLDLVRVIKYVESKKWQIKKDIGILSFNESLLKSIIAIGISTIGPDFTNIGRQVANLIVDKNSIPEKSNFQFIERNSF